MDSTREDAGNYTLKAVNCCGTVTTEVEFEVSEITEYVLISLVAALSNRAACFCRTFKFFLFSFVAVLAFLLLLLFVTDVVFFKLGISCAHVYDIAYFNSVCTWTKS